jgi:hypothetical protein
MAARDFVKAGKTSTGVPQSKMELERILRRYGAEQFSTAQDYSKGLVVVQFTIPNTPDRGARMIPVRFPVESRRIYDRLFGRPASADGYNPKRLEQAERVAWRNVILWVDAQLSAASIGLQTVEEAFIAHAAIGPGGVRLIEALPAMLIEETRRLTSGGA